jgi:hypothetical protein
MQADVIRKDKLTSQNRVKNRKMQTDAIRKDKLTSQNRVKNRKLQTDVIRSQITGRCHLRSGLCLGINRVGA